MGRARSLMASTILGFAGVAGLILLALREESPGGSLIGIHLNVLLEGTEKRAGLVPADESSASRGFRSSVLQDGPAHWKLLGLLKLQESL